MPRSTITRLHLESLMAPATRCFSRHRFIPPNFVPSTHSRLSPTNTRSAEAQARGVCQAVSNETEESGSQTVLRAIITTNIGFRTQIVTSLFLRYILIYRSDMHIISDIRHQQARSLDG